MDCTYLTWTGLQQVTVLGWPRPHFVFAPPFVTGLPLFSATLSSASSGPAPCHSSHSHASLLELSVVVRTFKFKRHENHNRHEEEGAGHAPDDAEHGLEAPIGQGWGEVTAPFSAREDGALFLGEGGARLELTLVTQLALWKRKEKEIVYKEIVTNYSRSS